MSGRTAGTNAGAAIEVRGLVPSSCGTRSEDQLTIFAQIEPTSSDSRERLLLKYEGLMAVAGKAKSSAEVGGR